jgi:hypothetical protein
MTVPDPVVQPSGVTLSRRSMLITLGVLTGVGGGVLGAAGPLPLQPTARGPRS